MSGVTCGPVYPEDGPQPEESWQPPDREPVAPENTGLIGAAPGHTLLPLSEDEADLIRALRGNDVAMTRSRIRRAVTDWFNEGDPLLNEQIDSLTDRIVVAIERKS